MNFEQTSEPRAPGRLHRQVEYQFLLVLHLTSLEADVTYQTSWLGSPSECGAQQHQAGERSAQRTPRVLLSVVGPNRGHCYSFMMVPSRAVNQQVLLKFSCLLCTLPAGRGGLGVSHQSLSTSV